jgi:hypothetical protein
MAMAAAPYLHPKLSAIEAKLSPAALNPSREKVEIVFVVPSGARTREDQE